MSNRPWGDFSWYHMVWTRCLNNQACDVIKMRKMRGEVGKKNPKKEIIPHFYDVKWMIFETLCPVTKTNNNI